MFFLKAFRRHFESWPDELLSIGLLLIGAFLIYVALAPDHLVSKAALFAWVVLP